LSEHEELRTHGLQIAQFSGEALLGAIQFRDRFPHLSLGDSLSVSLAREQPEAVLLTDDLHLIQRADSTSIVTKGLVWLLSELYQQSLIPCEHLCQLLHLLENIFPLPVDLHSLNHAIGKWC